MSSLFPIALRGLGTADVEGFGSYLHRAASAHGISTGRFLTHAVSWHQAMQPDRKYNLEGILSSPDVCVFVRPNQTTAQLVEVFSDATRIDTFRCGTFLALQRALDRSMNTFEAHLRWCPACVKEFEVLGDSGYFKLIWQLKALSHCPNHLVPLRSRCGRCNAYQGGFRARASGMTCIRCGHPLSAGMEQASRADSWMTTASDLIELVHLIAANASLEFPANGTKDVLTAIFDKVWFDEDECEFWNVMPRDECLGIVLGDQPVTLMTARRVAYHLGMHLPDLLEGAVSLTTSVLDPAWTAELPESMRRAKKRVTRDKTAILQRLQSMLSEERHIRQPPALEVVASGLGVSVGYLQHHFPMVSHEILEKHRNWVAADMNRKRLQARSAALSFLGHDRYALERKSRKNALRVLRAETGLPKNILREEIWSIFRERQRDWLEPRCKSDSFVVQERPAQAAVKIS